MNGMDSVLALNYLSVALALLIAVVAALGKRTSNIIRVLAWLSILSFAAASSILLLKTMDGPVQYYNGLVIHDKFTAFLLLGISLTGTLALIGAGKDPLIWESSPGYYSLLPLVLFGSFIITGVTDTLTLIAAWLLVSVINYVFIALPPDKESRGAAVRYIVIGAVATLFLLVWLTGNSVVASIQGLQGLQISPLTLDKISGLTIAAFIAALGFKIGVVPFHWWVPSVYGKAEGRVVALVAGLTKLAFIGVLARVVYLASGGNLGGVTLVKYPFVTPAAAKNIALILGVLAVASMFYGNIAAVATRDMKIMLSYSAIAQVGYILAALSAVAYFAGSNEKLAYYAMAAVAVQAVAYGLAKAPLFTLTGVAERIERLRGLMSRDSISAASVGILLMSLLGLPPMLGFWGKILMFYAVAGFSIILVIISFINTTISAAFYIRMTRDIMATDVETDVIVPGDMRLSLLTGALLIIFFGFIAPIVFSIA